MKEAIYIMGESCTRCHIMKPHIVKRATINGYGLKEVYHDDEIVKDIQIESVPMLIIKEDGEIKEILNEEGIVNMISKQ